MPQLDKFSFFSQVFWLILIFLIVYYYFILLFLPNLSAQIKIRYKKLYELKKDILHNKSIEIYLLQLHNKHFFNILLLSNKIYSHYMLLLNKYHFSVVSKMKKYVRYRNKIDKKKLNELLEKILSKRY